MDGLEVAYKYVPAKPLETHGQGIQTQVGGDWYDIIPLSAGRVGIVIGDVEGRGARAAAVMGQLRAALRAFAQDDKSPAEILRRLDDWVRALGPAAAEDARLRRRRSADGQLHLPGLRRVVPNAVVLQRRACAAADRARHDVSQLEIRTGASCSACAARACPGCRPTARRTGTWRPARRWSSTPTA